MKLEKLTSEQEALLPVFRDRALQFALSGEDELDVEKFHRGTTFVYSLAKLDDPIKIHVDSPLGIQFACQIIKNLPMKHGAQVQAQVWDQVRDQVQAQVWAQVQAQVRAQVRAQVGAQVQAQVRAQVRDQVGAQVRDQVGAQVQAQVRVREYQTPAYMGVGFDSGLAAFYKVFIGLGILKYDLFTRYAEFIDSGVWDTVLFQGAAIGCRRPNFVSRDDEHRLHNDNRSAISWRDGFELFYLDGVGLKQDIWQRIVSQEMAFDEIVAIQNADERAVALKYNKNAIIASGAELIDEHPTAGELFLIERKPINDILDERQLYFLRMKCPTGRVFVEAVEPNFARANPYAVNCQAQAFGVPVEIYSQLRREG